MTFEEQLKKYFANQRRYPNGGAIPSNPIMGLLPLLFGNKQSDSLTPAQQTWQQDMNNTNLTAEILDKMRLNKSPNMKPVLYNVKEDTIPLTEGNLRGAKVSPKLLSDIKTVATKHGVDPFDILAIAGKESTFGYGKFGGARRDEQGNSTPYDLFTFNDLTSINQPKSFLEFAQSKGDKRVSAEKGFHGYEYNVKSDNDYNSLYSDKKLIDSYKSYLAKLPDPKQIDILDEVAKRIKTRGIASYNPGQKDYVQKIEEYKQLLKNNKTPIKFQFGGQVMTDTTPFNFVMPSSHLTPDYAQKGLNSFFSDPAMVPEASLGGFFKSIGNGITRGLGAFGDQALSFLGMPNVIKNSAYDSQPKWLQGLNSGVGSIAKTAVGVAVPGSSGVLNGLSALAGGVNSFTGGNSGFGSLLGGGYDYGDTKGTPYNSGSMLTGLQPSGLDGVLKSLFAGIKGFEEGGESAGEDPSQQGAQTQQGPSAMTPIQTETGEYFLHLDNTITKTNATEKHSQMDDDEVTDIVPEGTYVASNDKKIKMTRKEAEEIVMGLKAMPYEEFKKGKIPEKILFSKIFNQNKMTPAELSAAILKMLPTVDKSSDFTKNDIFTEITNEENIKNRAPWLEQVVIFNESKRTQNQPMQHKKGGPVLRMKDVVSMPQGGQIRKFGPGGSSGFGDIASILGTALPFLSNIFGKQQAGGIDPLAKNMILGSAPAYQAGLNQNINAQQNALGQGITDFTGLGQSLNQYAGLSAGANIAGLMSQDTSYGRFNKQEQDSRLANFDTSTPQSFIDAQTPKYDLNSLAASLGPRGFQTFGAQLAGQQSDARNAAAMHAFDTKRSYDMNILGQRNQLDSFSQQFNLGQSEKEMAAKNAQTAGVFGNVGSYFNRLGDIQSQILPITTGFNLQRAGLEGQKLMGGAQNAMNIGSVLAGLGQKQITGSGTGNNFNLLKSLFGGKQNSSFGGNSFDNLGKILTQMQANQSGKQSGNNYSQGDCFDAYGNPC